MGLRDIIRRAFPPRPPRPHLPPPPPLPKPPLPPVADIPKVVLGPGASTVIEVVEGKPVVVAAREAIAAQLTPAVLGADVKAYIENLKRDVALSIGRQIGGKAAEDFVADFFRVTHPLPDQDKATLLLAVQKFIRTGDMNYLVPLGILAAGEIASARNLVAPRSKAIPSGVISIMPQLVQDSARKSSYLSLSEVPGKLNLPAFAINELHRATAITLVDVIVFERVPSTQTMADRHLWAHELRHILQYETWGLTDFATRYMAEETGFHSARPAGGGPWVNAVEVEAIAFACKSFPVDNPGYGGHRRICSKTHSKPRRGKLSADFGGAESPVGEALSARHSRH
jgi:hypothetical protein